MPNGDSWDLSVRRLLGGELRMAVGPRSRLKNNLCLLILKISHFNRHFPLRECAGAGEAPSQLGAAEM